MLNRSRLVGALVALILPAVTAISGVPSAAAATPTLAVPPACVWNSPSLDCVHAPSPGLAALAAPTFTTSYDKKTSARSVSVNAAITPPYAVCQGNSPALPCSEPGLRVSWRVYAPGETSTLSGDADPTTGSCDFSCVMQFPLPTTYHGPATVILTYHLYENVSATGNPLASSTVETTIALPANPFVGAMHVTKPTRVLAGKLRTQTINLAGKGGVPKTGVAGMVVAVWTNGEGEFTTGGSFGGGTSILFQIPGTTLHIVKAGAGSVTVTVMGWYAKAASSTGDLLHVRTHGIGKIANGVSLKSKGIPLDATGVLVKVVTPKGATRIGTVLLTKSPFAQYVLVPLTHDKLAVKAAKGASVKAYGWTGPVQVIDDGIVLDPTAGTVDLSAQLSLV